MKVGRFCQCLTVWKAIEDDRGTRENRIYDVSISLARFKGVWDRIYDGISAFGLTIAAHWFLMREKITNTQQKGVHIASIYNYRSFIPQSKGTDVCNGTKQEIKFGF